MNRQINLLLILFLFSGFAIYAQKNQGNDTWNLLSQSQSAKTWAGYAYENICLKHLAEIKKAMSILGIYSSASAYFKKGTDTEKGMQIDLVLDRKDHTINLFEIKFYNKPTTLTKEYADKMRQILWDFQEKTGTNKQVNWVFISTFGLTPNAHSVGLISKSLTFNDLF